MSTVIIGSGHGGIQVALSLRSAGYTEPVTVITEETATPYQRPPLSKDYLKEDGDPTPVPLITDDDIQNYSISVLKGTSVSEINREKKYVVADGDKIPYINLVIATGARARRIPTDGADAAGVYRLKTLQDAEHIKGDLTGEKRVVVVGAGFIGMEFAVMAQKRGCTVTVLEFANRPMGRALSEPMSEWFSAKYKSIGIDLHLNEGLSQVETDSNNRAIGVTSTNGEFYPADLVLTGIGVVPNSELAEAAGLDVANGIVVDENLRTSDHSIYAIGDCASFPTTWALDRVRLESVQNATDQGKHVAKTIMEGPSPYTALPWFWSTQGVLRLQMTGIPQPGDEVRLIGNQDEAKFTYLLFRDGYLVGAESVNRPSDQNAVRRLLNDNIKLKLEVADEPDFELRQFLKEQIALQSV